MISPVTVGRRAVTADGSSGKAGRSGYDPAMAEPAAVRDAFQALARQPRHMGRMADADGIGNVGSIVVGRALRVFIKLDGGSIERASFQVFACPEVVPSAVVLCDMLPGLSVDAAWELSDDDLCVQAGGLPRDDLPVVSWPLVGLRLALAAATGQEAPDREDQTQPALICRCHGISRQTIVETIAEIDGATTQAIIEATGAGTGCGTCRRDIAALVDQSQARQQPQAGLSRGLGRVALLKQIAEQADPILAEVRAVGGHWELWNLRGTQVEIRVVTALDEAQAGIFRDRLERVLRDEVDPVLSVVTAAS